MTATKRPTKAEQRAEANRLGKVYEASLLLPIDAGAKMVAEAKRLHAKHSRPTKAERDVLLTIAANCDHYTTNEGNGRGWSLHENENTSSEERAAFRRLARELRASAEGKERKR